MCILFLAINQHPEYPLIVAANRDESFQRPSQSMHHWQDCQGILAGRDMLKGGSWLGINQSGRFCAVTNFRTGRPEGDQARSRGELVQRYLSGADNDDQFLGKLQSSHKQYNPFNLVFGELGRIMIFCSEDSSLHHLNDGYHSVSNGFIDQQWPKMSGGVRQLTSLIEQKSSLKISQLNTIMRDRTKADLTALPDTGVSPDIEKYLSSIFIVGAEYGTRTTTYLLYSKSDVTAHEINYDQIGSVVDEQIFCQLLPRI